MSKTQSNQKGHHMKSKSHAEDVDSVPGTENLDANQSAKSMNAGEGDTNLSTNIAEDAVSAVDTLGTDKEFNTPYNLESDKATSSASSASASVASTVSQTVSDVADSLLERASSVIDTKAVKKNINLVKQKAQDFVHTGKDQVSSKFSSLSDDVKLRGMLVDDSVKSNPYAYALGAVGIGFILGRAFSGKGKSDLDALVSTVNKINFSTLAGMFGGKVANEADAKEGYNSDQARKIG